MKGGTQTTAHKWKILLPILLLVLITQVYSAPVDVITVTDAKQKGAVCLDGSPAIYYHNPGTGDAINNWIVVLEGGWWCFNDETCNKRGVYGTSTQSSALVFSGILSSDKTINPDFYNWSKAFLHYCDGGSFLGDTEVVNEKYSFQLRGSKIFDAVMAELLAKGMKNAANALLMGGSAGGLASMLHCDIYAALLPHAGKVKCMSDGGFILRAPDLPYAWYRDALFVYTTEYHKLTGQLPITCTSTNASLCLFPEYFAANIKTPLFIINSAFDSFQIHDNLQPVEGDYAGWRNCTDHYDCKPSHKQVVMDFGKEFKQVVQKVGDKPSTGMFISTCYVHGFSFRDKSWNSDATPRLENKTVAQALGDWYFDRSPVKLIDPNDFLVNCHLEDH